MNGKTKNTNPNTSSSQGGRHNHQSHFNLESHLIHWGWVTDICISNLTIIGSDNGLSPGQRQAIIWTNAGILLIGPWGTNLSEILIKGHTFSSKKMHLNMLSAKCWPFCLGLNVLIWQQTKSTWQLHIIQCYCLKWAVTDGSIVLPAIWKW